MRWCTNHEARTSTDPEHCNVAQVWWDADPYEGGSVDPDCYWTDAVVIVKEDGVWPEWALDRIRYRGKAIEAMDALADLADVKPWKASQARTP